MADVYTYVEPTGVIVTDAQTILTEVNTEFQNTFGQAWTVPDINNPQGASTPQGLLIISETLARIAVADNNAMLANQINPNVAGGIFLDAILALTGTARTPATPSTVTATITGVAGTIIPQGSQASETIGNNVFETTQIYTIPAGGTLIGAIFKSVVPGPVSCAQNTLTNIISQVLGWERITSNSAAILGSATQSDAAARAFRNSTISQQSSSSALAIISGVTTVINNQSAPAFGVASLKFLENNKSTTQTISGVSMVRNSIYVCVNGGDQKTTYSSVVGTITGTPTTSIAAGSEASSNGFVFETLNTVVIGMGGTVDTIFQSVTSGPVPCPPGTLTTIVTPIAGWASVTNALDGTLGVESNVALALTSKKSAGAAYNNGPGVQIMATVIEPTSGQYLTVLYDNPNQIAINIIIDIRIVTPIQDPITSVQNAIINYANGKVSGLVGFTVGQNVSSFELSGAVVTQLSGIYVQNLLIAKNPSVPSSSAEIAINVYEIATVIASNITVNVLS